MDTAPHNADYSAIKFISQLMDYDVSLLDDPSQKRRGEKRRELMTNTLYIEYYAQWVPDAILGDVAFMTWAIPNNIGASASEQAIANIVPGAPVNVSASPFPVFPTIDSAFSYYMTSMCNQLVTDTNTAYGTPGYYTAYDAEPVEPTVKTALDALPTVAHTGNYADLIGKPALATVATTGNYNDLSNKPATGGTRTQSALTLSLVSTGATGTQIDATHDALILCTVSTSATANISGGATSTVVLKICATNNATEASWTTVATSETSQSYSLAVAIQGVTGMKEQLSSLVPAGWYAKLVNSGSGTHSEAFVSGQKTIFS